jgi:glycosyltransferase involved in cell wall biosynthesis
MNISIVIPVFNEEASIEALYAEICGVLPKDMAPDFVFVNDGSYDGTLHVLLKIHKNDPRVRILDLSRNFGHQLAITAGMDYAEGDVCVIMDADLQHPPEILPQMIELWRQGAQIVHAQRSARDTESIFKRCTAIAFYALLRSLGEVNVVPGVGDYCLMDKLVVDACRHLREPHRYLRGLHQWVGFRHAVLPYQRHERKGGKSHYTLARMIRLSLDAVTSFSVLPLRASAYLGIMLAFLSGIYALYTLYIKFVARTSVPGWTSLMIVVLFMGGVQLVTLGILGEYIGRIYNQGKNRPLYLISKIYS